MVGLIDSGWDLGLRDASLETWSRPNKSKTLDRVFKKKTTVAAPSQPKLHSKEAVAIHAATLEEEKKLMLICQKSERTADEVKFAQSYMAQFPFFKLWPDAVQRELARVLLTEVRVCHETIISRGTPLTKVYFLLRGHLQVSVPEAPDPGASFTDSRASGGHRDPSTRNLATLRKGDTCGEAVLLGNAAAHADVVVTSPGAVLLSLCHADFLKALKEILGLRQQDRLMYLRMHPLFVEVALEDLDKASDMLNMAFFSPGSLMSSPSRSAGPDGQRVYFIAEGQCAVKRHGANAHGPGAAAALQLEAERAAPVYDNDTVSVLGPLDAFGLENPGSRSLGGLCVESLTQVKAYYFTMEQFLTLPKAMQQAVKDASSFKARYLRGRAQVLNRLDEARRDPHYGAMTYSLGDAKLSTVGHLPSSPSKGGAGAGSRGGGRPGAGGRSGATATGLNSKVAATLDKLAAEQVRELLEMDAAREAATAVGLPAAAAHELLATCNLSTMHATARSFRDTAPRGMLSVPQSASRRRYQQQQLYQQQYQQQQLQGLLQGHGVGAGMGAGLAAVPFSPALAGPARPKGQAAAATKHAPGPDAVRLSTLPPDTTTWSRLAGARNRTAVTEAPRPQPVPTSLRQRHTAVFRAAQQVSHRAPGITGNRSESDDEQLIDGFFVSKQVSRRLSTRLRHSDERGPPGSAGWYDGRSGQVSAVHGAGMRGYADGLLPPAREWAAAPSGHSIDRDLRASLAPAEDWDMRQYDSESATGRAQSTAGGLNATLRKGSGSRAVSSGSDTAAAADPGWGMGAEQPESDLDGGYEGQHHTAQQQWEQHQQQPPLEHHQAHEHNQGLGRGQGHGMEPEHNVSDLQDMHEKGRVIKQRPGRGGGAGPAALPQQQQRHHTDDLSDIAAGGGGPVVGLPASVVLGYDNLSPFQWAALMHGPQDSVLPKPKW